MPAGVFRPYAGVSTGVIVFVKGGTTENVWFYDMDRRWLLARRQAREGGRERYPRRDRPMAEAETVLRMWTGRPRRSVSR